MSNFIPNTKDKEFKLSRSCKWLDFEKIFMIPSSGLKL